MVSITIRICIVSPIGNEIDYAFLGGSAPGDSSRHSFNCVHQINIDAFMYAQFVIPSGFWGASAPKQLFGVRISLGQRDRTQNTRTADESIERGAI